MPALHQFVPTLDPGAIGSHVLEIQRCLRQAGWSSEIFAEHVRSPYEGLAHPFTEYGRSRPAGDADIVVYHAAIGSSVADWLLSRRPSNLVIDYHNITPPAFYEGWEPAVAYGLAWGRAQLRHLARRARVGLADSAFNATELAEAGCRRTAVLPILIPPEALQGAPDGELVDRLRRGPGTRWLFVGRISPNKRQHLLVAALAAHRRAFDPDATLALVGGVASERYAAAIGGFAADLGVAPAVTVTGAVSDAARNAYYATADVFVCLSAHEGFCVPLLEAWHHDVPVVAHAAAAVPETLGRAGVLLAGTDAPTVAATVERVVGDGRLADALRAAGRARLEELSIERARTRLRELAAELAGAGDERPELAAELVRRARTVR